MKISGPKSCTAKKIFIFLSYILILINFKHASAKSIKSDSIQDPHLVVLLTTKNLKQAQYEAKRAAELLGYPIATATINNNPPLQRVYVGAIISLHRTTSGQYAVVSYLGAQKEIAGPLQEAKKFYPKARAIRTVLPKEADSNWISQPSYRLGVLIVGSYPSYTEALKAAKIFSKASKMPYESMGMIYDKKRGLILPDNSKDTIWAGQYLPRRYDECQPLAKPCVSIERSEAYEGFQPGLYIVVAGILDNSPKRNERLGMAKKIVPDAYIKATTIYLGCVH